MNSNNFFIITNPIHKGDSTTQYILSSPSDMSAAKEKINEMFNEMSNRQKEFSFLEIYDSIYGDATAIKFSTDNGYSFDYIKIMPNSSTWWSPDIITDFSNFLTDYLSTSIC